MRKNRPTGQVIIMVAVLVLAVILIGTAHAAGWIIAIVFLAPIIIASDLGESRGRSGWMWGLFLGWLGVLILACMRPLPKQIAQ